MDNLAVCDGIMGGGNDDVDGGDGGMCVLFSGTTARNTPFGCIRFVFASVVAFEFDDGLVEDSAWLCNDP